MRTISWPPAVVGGVIILWALAAGLGFARLLAHQAAPGRPGAPSERWPAGSTVPLDGSRPTLLIFVHPRCPCSPASLAGLARAAARCPGRFSAHLMVYRPERAGPGWEREVAVDPSVAVAEVDVGGREAGRFGVETSGHVLLFDPSGRRLFGGGITMSRGHEGDNPGLDALVGAIRGDSADPGPFPVFGCRIVDLDPARRAGRGG